MKIRKTAEQKNFQVDTTFYTERELREFEEEHLITDLHKVYPDCVFEEHFVVFADDCTDIKVIYIDTIGSYATVVDTKDGTTIAVEI